MVTPRRCIIEYIERGIIPADRIPESLKVTGVTPNGQRWLVFIEQLLLWLGGLALAFSTMFFVAYNWDAFGRFAQFGIVETIIVFAIVAYCRAGDQSIVGHMSLVVATLSLGVLLALYGQTYQTGADTWQLFFNWALLMLPWTIIGRFPSLWIIWVALINISTVLYFQTFRGIFGIAFSSDMTMFWLLFSFNTAVLIGWHLLERIWHWLAVPWAVRLVALGSGVPLTWLVLVSIFDYRNTVGYPALVWIVWLVGMYYWYRRINPDLFMLAGCCLSTIAVSVSFFGKHMMKNGNAGGFLFLAIVTISMGALAATWLKSVHKEDQS